MPYELIKIIYIYNRRGINPLKFIQTSNILDIIITYKTNNKYL